MINLSQKNIVRIATETGFIKDNVEKVLRLVNILDAIYKSEWKEKLILKGGTAINLFYMDLPRLSVDIDLDYIGLSREEMLADRERLCSWLKNVLFQQGYTLSDASKNYFALDSMIFRYSNNANNLDNIKVEINFLNRTHILPACKMRVAVKNIESEAAVHVLNKQELYGSKLAALIGRCKPRDVYDVYRMIADNVIEDKALLRKCAIFYNCIGGEANIDVWDIGLLDGVSKRDFDRMLKPVLIKDEKFNEKEAVALIKDYLSALLQLTDDEKQFVSEFRNKRYKPDLLFAESEITERIEAHPMALWRMK